MVVLSKVVVEAPKGVDAERVKHRIGAIIDLVVSNEFGKFIECLKEYALLRI